MVWDECSTSDRSPMSKEWYGMNVKEHIMTYGTRTPSDHMLHTWYIQKDTMVHIETRGRNGMRHVDHQHWQQAARENGIQ